MQPAILPSKFDGYILNNHEEGALLDSLNLIFSNVTDHDNLLSNTNGFVELGGKNHVVKHANLDGWIIKGMRNDNFPTTPDTHIYRVRRAAHLRNLIDKNRMTEIVVPEKFLYQCEGKWFVIAKELQVKPSSHPNEITPQQAREFITLCFTNKIEDVSSENFKFTEDNKIALLDTEPIRRHFFKKKIFKHLPLLKDGVKLTSNIINAERFARLVSNQEIKEEIRTIQKRNYLRYMATLITKLAIPLIVSGALLLGATYIGSSTAIALLATATAIAALYALYGIGLSIITVFTYHNRACIQ